MYSTNVRSLLWAIGGKNLNVILVAKPATQSKYNWKLGEQQLFIALPIPTFAGDEGESGENEKTFTLDMIEKKWTC